MVTFILLAAVMLFAGVALVAVPLLRRTSAQQEPAPWAALGAVGALVLGSALIYAGSSNWSWSAKPAGADSPQQMVASLARKLERNPEDLEGWLMLGRSYVVLQQYPLALRSFQRADRLAAGKNVEALLGQAEALSLSDQRELSGRAGHLIEQALTLEPNSGKALFFGAAAAEQRGNPALARERFAKLLAMDPPAAVRPILEQQIAALDQRLAGPATVGTAPAANSPPAAAAKGDANAAAVRVQIALAPGLAQAASESAPLFVFVRDPAQPGPPLAAKRLASHFPQTVELTPSDAMVPGRAFAAGQKVQVVARIARSGNPIAASGDPVGEAAYQVGQDGLVKIVIDHLTP